MTEQQDRSVRLEAPIETESGSDVVIIEGTMDEDNRTILVHTVQSPNSIGNYDPPLPIAQVFTQQEWSEMWICLFDHCLGLTEELEAGVSKETGGESIEDSQDDEDDGS